VTAAWLRLRTELRTSWRRRVVVAVLVGVGVGVVAAVAAGARRTDDAYRRFEARHAPSDLFIVETATFGIGGGTGLDEIARLDDVRDVVEANGWFFLGRSSDGAPVSSGATVLLGDASGAIGRDIDRWKILEGRRPDPTRADEVVVAFALADELDLDVGDTIDITLADETRVAAVLAQYLTTLSDRLAGIDPTSPIDEVGALDLGPELTLHVVGIEASPHEFPPVSGAIEPPIHVTPAFHARYAPGNWRNDYLAVRLRPGADVDRFVESVRALPGGVDATVLSTRVGQAAAVGRTFSLLALAFALLAGLLAVSVATIAVQQVRRLVLSEGADAPTLRAVGFTRRVQWGVALLMAALTGAVAAVAAAAVMLSMSPLWPVGLARIAEVAPGVHIDGVVLAIAVACCAIGIPGVSALPAWRATSTTHVRDVSRRPRAADAFARAGWPLAVVLGASFGFDRRRGEATDRRASAVGLAAIVAALATTLTFSGALAHFVGTPSAYGWQWHAQLGGAGFPDLGDGFVTGLRRNEQLDAVSVGTIGTIEVEGRAVSALAVDPVVGSLEPSLLDGDAPRGPGEIVLGTRTLRSIGARVGDLVSVRIADATLPVRVVGRAVFPDVGDLGRLGTGAMVTFAALREQRPDSPVNVALVRVRDPERAAIVTDQLSRAVAPLPVTTSESPDDLLTFASAADLGRALGGIFAVLGTATIFYALATSVRRLRRDLAILKVLGCGRARLARAVGCQAVGIGLFALVVGVPIGVVGGRFAWVVFARSLGTEESAPVPVLALSLLAVAMIVLPLLAAIGPGLSASRTPAARVLRSE
jgi:ABC-type lipoprotein release transport system permease subunit